MSSAKHVLVVEDHEDTLDLLSLAFRNDGFRVTGAKNGREGLEVLLNDQTQVPTLVLLDLDMPEMSGRQFLDVKQAYSRLAAIPVIVFTATDDKLSDPVIVAHFRKPMDPLVLVRAAQAAVP